MGCRLGNARGTQKGTATTARSRWVCACCALTIGSASAATHLWLEGERFRESTPHARRRSMLEGGLATDPGYRNRASQDEGLELRGNGAEATHTAIVPVAGRYTIWSRSDDWQSAWAYTVEVSDQRFAARPDTGLVERVSPARNALIQPAGQWDRKLPEAGVRGHDWTWHRVGTVELPQGEAQVSLSNNTTATVRLDVVLLTNAPEHRPRGIAPPSWLSDRPELTRVDLRSGFPGQPLPPGTPLPNRSGGRATGPADAAGCVFVYPYDGFYLVAWAGAFWGAQRSDALEFRLPRVGRKLSTVVVYPPSGTRFERGVAQVHDGHGKRHLPGIARNGVLTFTGEIAPDATSRLVVDPDVAGVRADSNRASPTTGKLTFTETASGCEITCNWGRLRFDRAGRLCSLRLNPQRDPYDLIDRPLTWDGDGTEPAAMNMQHDVEPETGWERIRLQFARQGPHGGNSVLSYSISEDAFVTVDVAAENPGEQMLGLGWDFSDRFTELQVVDRGPLDGDRYSLVRTAGKRRYVGIDAAPAGETLAGAEAGRAISLDLLDGDNCHVGLIPLFHDGHERWRSGRDRSVRIEWQAKQYRNTFLLHLYPTVNLNPKRLHIAGAGGVAPQKGVDPYAPMRSAVYATDLPDRTDRFQPFLATHLMPVRDMSRWGDWDVLLQPEQYRGWRSRLDRYRVDGGHYYQNNPALTGTRWSPFMERDRIHPTWLGSTTQILPARTKLCMSTPYAEHFFWQIMDAVQRRGEQFIYFDAFLPTLCRNRGHAERPHLPLLDTVRFLRRVRANAPEALIIVHGHPSVDVLAFRRYGLYMPGEGGAGRNGQRVDPDDLAPFEWGATCYPLRPLMDERGIEYYWDLVRTLARTGSHPFPFRAVFNHEIPADVNWERHYAGGTLAQRYVANRFLSPLPLESL